MFFQCIFMISLLFSVVVPNYTAMYILSSYLGIPSWNSSAVLTMCTNWTGVECDALNRVTSIDVSGIGTGGSLPTDIGSLIFMTRLDLHRNSLSGTIPLEIGYLALLRTLDLSGNNFDGLVPFTIEFLSNLNTLNLARNKLFGPIPGTIFQVPLTYIDLSSNLFLSLLEPNFIGATRLQTLNLDNNLISGTIANEIGNFSFLTSLNIGQNKFDGTIPSAMARLSKLSYLNMHANGFTGTLPTEFGNLVFLQTLLLDSTSISGTIPTEFATLIRLETIALSDTLISGNVPKELVTWKLLDNFRMNNVALTSYCWPFIQRLGNCDMADGTIYNCSCTSKVPDNCGSLITNVCPPTLPPSDIPTLPPNSPVLAPVNSDCGNGILDPFEQCDDGNRINGDGCDNLCFIEYGWNCIVTNSPSTCALCYGPWIPVTVGESALCSSCVNGTILLSRIVYPECSSNYSTYDVLSCSFPCLPDSGKTFDNVVNTIGNNNSLEIILSQLGINVQVRASYLDENTIEISFLPCTASLNMSYVESILSIFLQDTFHISYPISVLESGCTFLVRKVSQSSSSLVYVSAVAAVGVLLIILLVFFLYYYYFKSPLHKLPKEISWSFLDNLTHRWNWSRPCDEYYIREYEKDSSEWNRVYNLFPNGFNELPALRIHAIYNPTLTVSFINLWRIYKTRKTESPDLFFNQNFSKDEKKLWVMEQYENLSNNYTWNRNLNIPIIPAMHGTDYYVAEKIAQTGFAALASLDAGYFGRGIYFTTYILYTLPYSCSKRNPSVVLGYLTLGNVFPVTEHHKGDESLLGLPLRPGYNSHFVVTNKEGAVYNQSSKANNFNNELIVSQESQILPAFIISFDLQSCKEQYSRWNRETTENDNFSFNKAMNLNMTEIELTPNNNIIKPSHSIIQLDESQSHLHYENV